MFSLIVIVSGFGLLSANHDAKRLYDDLLRKNKYNKLVRPVGNSSAKLTVKLGLKLSQLIDVDEKNEIMTTNMWVLQEWEDYSLRWDPQAYGEVKTLYVPSESIWLPDIVLYNNADGDYTVTLMTKATITWYGKVTWEPPAIFKSQCNIDTEFFPFDEQVCTLKFGSWTYDGHQLDLKHQMSDIRGLGDLELVEQGIDLKNYYTSVEWDVMGVPAKKKNKYYPCCKEPFPDVSFNITLRRKRLFYAINLIIPCICIEWLTILVFYLPSDSGEKISLSISILLSLSIFQLLLFDIVPATSLKVPLVGKYIIFTVILVSLSVFVSVCTLNVRFRGSSTHKMSAFTRLIFIKLLPKLMMMHIPSLSEAPEPTVSSSEPFDPEEHGAHCGPMESNFIGLDDSDFSVFCKACTLRKLRRNFPPNAVKALNGAHFIGQHAKDSMEAKRVRDDWNYVALVMDRLLLYIYLFITMGGTVGILLRAPSLYDIRLPIK